MRKKAIVFITFLALFLSTLILAAEDGKGPEAQPCLSVAVLDFATSGSKSGDLGSEISIMLTTKLSNMEGVVVVERQELEKLLSEQELGISGTITPDTATKIGALTGAKVLVTGRAFEKEGIMFIVAKVIGAETSRVYGDMISFPESGLMEQSVEKLASKLSGLIKEKAATLVAKVESEEDIISGLKEMVKGKELPSVSVNVSEIHFGQPIPDPAVETEISSILHQLGFKVIVPKISTETADILISGDAFSEFAIRRGNLVTCKGRLEVKAYKKGATGELLAVDRQTELAVDLSERIAGKTALQKGAAKLAKRLVPKLILK